jgi:hypothetical protein
LHNIIGAPFIWLASDGGVALAPERRRSVAGIKRSSLKGVFGTIVAAPTNEKYKTNMKKRYDEYVASGFQVSYNGQIIPLRPEVHVFAPYAYDAMMIALTALNDLYDARALRLQHHRAARRALRSQVRGHDRPQHVRRVPGP